MSRQGLSPRVAVIDTDSGFVQVLVNRMESAGWSYRALAAAVQPDELLSMKLSALVIDPKVAGDGRVWEYLETICTALPDLVVVVASTKSTVAQRVRALRLGADDWVEKPCHPEEVLARIEALLRRRRRQQAETDVGPRMVGEMEIRPDQFQALVAGSSIDLTRKEFELLQLLADNQGRVLERETIYQRVWGYSMAHGDRSVDVFVRKLRHKLERNSANWAYIHTHFGIGYRFDPEPRTPAEPVEPAPRPEGVAATDFGDRAFTTR